MHAHCSGSSPQYHAAGNVDAISDLQMARRASFRYYSWSSSLRTQGQGRYSDTCRTRLARAGAAAKGSRRYPPRRRYRDADSRRECDHLGERPPPCDVHSGAAASRNRMGADRFGRSRGLVSRRSHRRRSRVVLRKRALRLGGSRACRGSLARLLASVHRAGAHATMDARGERRPRGQDDRFRRRRRNRA